MRIAAVFCISLVYMLKLNAQPAKRLADLGVRIGVMEAGKWNAITDVAGVKVGQTTLVRGDSVRTGVTAVLPYSGNIFQGKVPAAVFVGNGFGKLAGSTQVEELGNLETPVVLTNTLSVSTAMNAVITYTLEQAGNAEVRSVNAVVGETNDGYLNDIRGRHVQEADVLEAIASAADGPVAEGNVGAGTGTICFGFKGGIGTASRVLPAALGGYTVGVLVQTNFGGVLQAAGVPVGVELKKYYLRDHLNDSADGSCMIVVATDAPLDARNLKRLARRAFMGLAKTGGIASNGSGDYVIAFSTDSTLRIPYQNNELTIRQEVLHNDAMSPLFLAVNEATEEAILNSLIAAQTMQGKNGRVVEALPQDRLIEILKKYNRID
ncbi:MAG: S58 family peptidase [Bacteroidetes bacterium]|nr:MAG: S58 family peptidase [Bacteroidota bacterium]